MVIDLYFYLLCKIHMSYVWCGILNIYLYLIYKIGIKYKIDIKFYITYCRLYLHIKCVYLPKNYIKIYILN